MLKKVLCILILITMVSASFVGCATNEDSFTLEDYVKTMDYRDGFTILQLTDLHWSTGTQIGDEDYGQEKYVRELIKEAEAHAGKIDLIELTGDTFMLSNRSTVESFIEMMEDIQIPYAMLWGNHDMEGEYNCNWLCKTFSKAKYCIYLEVDNDDVYGRSNFVINLMDGDDVCWQLFQLDSGSSYRGKATDLFLTYDYIREDQFDWMEKEHKAAGENVPGICYYHIPQADNDLAYDAINNGASGYKSKFFKLEGFAASEYAPTTETEFLNNNIKAAFMGHAHAIDWTYTTPSGIIYGCGVKTGLELYYGKAEVGYADAGFEVEEAFDIVGASLVTLEDKTGNLKLEHLYFNERDEQDFVLWVEY